MSTTDTLKRAAAEYRRREERAETIRAEGRRALLEAVKAAHADGMSKSEIIRVTGGVWSRSWLDEVLGRRTRTAGGPGPALAPGPDDPGVPDWPPPDPAE